MSVIKEQTAPLGKIFALLTKQYLNILDEKIGDFPIDRYFYACWVIYKNNGNITSKLLSEVLQTDKVIVVRILKYLTKKNFIERIQHPKDKRSFLLQITPYGEHYLPQIEDAINATDQDFIDAIDTNNKDLVLSEITNLVNNVGPQGDDKIVLEYKRIN